MPLRVPEKKGGRMISESDEKLRRTSSKVGGKSLGWIIRSSSSVSIGSVSSSSGCSSGFFD